MTIPRFCKNPCTLRAQEHGFTLVELAIALMVIGLLIGGVLKGQELIENARVTRTIKDISDFSTATMIFRSTYGGLPGDLRRPSRVPNCNNPCNLTTFTGVFQLGNGRLDALLKSSNYWAQLHAAGMISGIESTEPRTDTHYPYSSSYNQYGGYFFAVHVETWKTKGPSFGTPTEALNKNMFLLSDSTEEIRPYNTTSANPRATLDVKHLEALDMKMDDGEPLQGMIRTNGDCVRPDPTNSFLVYNSTATNKCQHYIMADGLN